MGKAGRGVGGAGISSCCVGCKGVGGEKYVGPHRAGCWGLACVLGVFYDPFCVLLNCGLGEGPITAGCGGFRNRITMKSISS